MTDGHLSRTTRRGLLAGSGAVMGAAAIAPPASAALAGLGPALGRTSFDPDLRTLLKRVDPQRIGATIQRLTEFGTRHTLSSQDDPVRGIGAATTGCSSSCRRSPRPRAGT